MEVYFLTRDFSNTLVIDHFKSLLWTDRYNEYGDFEMYVEAEANILDYFEIGMYVTIKESNRIMVIETLDIATDIEEGNWLKISGRSAEALLDRRIIWKYKDFNGLLQDAINEILNENVLMPADGDRKLKDFNTKVIDNTNNYYKVIDRTWDGDNVYDVIATLCQENDLGFRVTLDDSNKFNFEIYTGKNRGWEQRENSYVIFSPRYENLLSTNYLSSVEDYKNVTLVGGEGEEDERFYTTVGEASDLDRFEVFTDSNTSRPTLTNEQVIFRVYNSETGAHAYSAASSERNTFLEAGWDDEGAVFVVSKVDDGPAVRRVYR